jgi:hypothetical protein
MHTSVSEGLSPSSSPFANMVLDLHFGNNVTDTGVIQASKSLVEASQHVENASKNAALSVNTLANSPVSWGLGIGFAAFGGAALARGRKN